MLEEMLKTSDRKAKGGLDAMIGCYLTLQGEEGVKLIEDLYLANTEAEYADTYSALMALRFHGTEGGVIPKERVVKAVRHMLKRPTLADLIIPDLARWEDWDSMDELVTLFKEADEKSSWVRVPVINFLRACPLPEAKERLAELEKIDPMAVKRANQFFPAGADPVPDSNKASDASSPTASGNIAAIPGKETSGSESQPGPKGWQPNLSTIICVPWVIGIALMLAQWGILRRR
jgi:hypothetical protein